MKELFDEQLKKEFKIPLPQKKPPKHSYFGTEFKAGDRIFYAGTLETVMLPAEGQTVNPVPTAIILPLAEEDFPIFQKGFEHIDLRDKFDKHKELEVFKTVPLFINLSRKV
jgi:hypothetical protein